MDPFGFTLQQAQALEQTVQNIHLHAGRQAKLALAIAGNGTEVIGWLMRQGRSSQTLLVQHVLTAQSALYDYLRLSQEKAQRIGFKAAHEQTARKLAYQAYLQAQELEPSLEAVGIGATSSLLKPDGERENRQHVIYVARHSLESTHYAKLQLRAKRRREDEERLCALVILEQIAQARGLEIDASLRPDSFLEPGEQVEYGSCQAPKALYELLTAQRSFYPINASGLDLQAPCIIYSGSWNPLHDAHRAIYELAKATLKLPAVFELSLVNADKGGLDWLEVQACQRQFEKESLPLIITPFATFEEKSRAFAKGCYFAMGADTLQRLLDPTYYQGGQKGLLRAIATFKERNNRFFVVCRKEPTGGLLSPHELTGFELIAPLVLEIPLETFCMPHRSKDLR